MVVDKCVTDREGIAAMIATLGLSGTPPQLGRANVEGELAYFYEE